MADIFISYSKSDRALALKLSTFLESEGWSVWWDKSLSAADHYRDEIMKQLVAARAVITIWSPNSIQSDWVRAEAGRAKADGKLIPVKTSELTYADIPLPFGEMHIENVTSTELIRAAIVAQLSKPALPQAPFWQITRTFKYQVLTWVGIVGSAITVFANLQGVLDLADWARELAKHWHEWNHIIWGWVFSLIGIKLPRGLAPVLSFTLFTIVLIVGVNLAERRDTSLQERRANGETGKDNHRGHKFASRFFAGVIYYVVMLFLAVGLIVVLLIFIPSKHSVVLLDTSLIDVFFVALVGGFPTCYLLYVVKDRRLLVLVASVLFFFMALCLFWVPLHGQSEPPYTELALLFMFPILWMAVILFSPLQQLTRRLGFVALSVLTLVGLSQISQLNLHQYVKPPKVSTNFGVSPAS